MKKVTQQHVKIHHNQLILKTIYNNSDRISRAEIARLTGLTRTTVSDVVSRLIKEGLVSEVGVGASEGGKPPILLKMVDDSRCLIGIDLADSEFQGALVDLRGKIKHRINLPVRDPDGDAAVMLVYELIDKLIPFADSPIVGIGIGTPGLIDVRAGVVRDTANLDWHNLPLGNLLRERYRLPVYISNDCQVAALGEFTFGNGNGVSNLIVIKIGRGTGAGIVLNRQLYYGDDFGAGEIGHVMAVENGQLCRCGKHGCLETVSCSRYIVKRAQEIAGENPQSPLHRFVSRLEDINTDMVLQAFNTGDNALRELICEVGRNIGAAAANLVGALNIQRIFVAGSVARFGSLLLESIMEEVKRRFLKELVDEAKIEFSSLGSDIVVLGAAALLLNNEMLLP